MKEPLRTLRELLTVLPADARRFLIGYTVSLALLAFLDAMSLALLAVVISPLVSNEPLHLPLVGDVEGVGLFVVLGVVCLLVVLKGVFAVMLLWYATRKFAKYELAIGSRLFDTYIASPWVERLKRNSSDLVRLTDSSIAQTISGVLLPGASLLGEALTFVTVVAVLAIAQPLVAVITVVYLGMVGSLLYFWVTRRSRQAGRVNLRYSLKVSRLITEMVGALKEITLRNKVNEVAEVVRANRVFTSRARSNIQFLNQVPRYVLESAIIGGFVLVGIAGYLVGGATYALTAVALFSLAGFRLAPSIVRFQAIISQITASLPHAQRVIDEIHISERAVLERDGRNSAELPAAPKSLDLRDLSFRYAQKNADAVSDVNISIAFGSTVAFVGASGAGKSTIIDLILGLIEPTGGTIAIDGLPLTEVTHSWRSRVGYVPQDVSLFDGTVAHNVALTWTDNIDRELVRASLEQAQLLSFVESRPGGIDGDIGERGLTLSGGQRQRLGIARALYARPLILVMDEATSALDTATEAAVTEAIKRLRGSVTVITVAHRLSTVMHADQIFFMSHGKVQAQGTFNELVATVPEFARQAGLAGLAGSETPSA